MNKISKWPIYIFTCIITFTTLSMKQQIIKRPFIKQPFIIQQRYKRWAATYASKYAINPNPPGTQSGVPAYILEYFLEECEKKFETLEKRLKGITSAFLHQKIIDKMLKKAIINPFLYPINKDGNEVKSSTGIFNMFTDLLEKYKYDMKVQGFNILDHGLREAEITSQKEIHALLTTNTLEDYKEAIIKVIQNKIDTKQN